MADASQDEQIFTTADDATGAPNESADQPIPNTGPLSTLSVWVRGLEHDQKHGLVTGSIPVLLGLGLLPFMPTLGTFAVLFAASTCLLAVAEKSRPTRVGKMLLGDPDAYSGGQAAAAVVGVLWVGVVTALATIIGVVL